MVTRLLLLVCFGSIPLPTTADCGTKSFQVSTATGQCFAFDLSGLPIDTFTVMDKIPEPYLVASPCSATNKSSCAACKNQSTQSPAYQLMPQTGCSGDRCIGLGGTPMTPTSVTGDAQGLTLAFEGGTDGRKFTYSFACDASIAAASSHPLLVVEEPTYTYTVNWPSSAGCGKAVTGHCTPPPPPPTPPLAKPTAAQMGWMAREMGAIGHFNMGTFHACGIGSNLMEGIPTADQVGRPFIDVPPANNFAPTDVNTDEWLEALASVGIERAVLVVSHGCGFNTFPSRTAFPEFGFVYNYTIAHSPYLNGTADIAADFIKSCKKYGIKPGFYHGAMNNAFLNVRSGVVGPTAMPGQAAITQDQYTKILLANLRQLWTDYGELVEVWFDGGYPPGSEIPIASLLQELQPNAVAFQGPGDNVIRWAGTEGGHVAPPFWSSAESSLTAGKGEPFGPVWSPAEADTCFQSACSTGDDLPGPYGGCWFYNSDLCPKKLSELVSSYHDSIGTNAFMLLDWTPTQTGRMRADHLQRYTEFGDYLKQCYRTSTTHVSNVTVNTSSTIDIAITSPIDRISIRETQATGQRVMGYEVWAMVGGTWQQQLSGQSIGNRLIGLFPAPLTSATMIRVNFTNIVGTTSLSDISLFNCTRVPHSASCDLEQNFAYNTPPGIVIGSSNTSGTSECCSLCLANLDCAQFVRSPTNQCVLLSANQGGAADKNFVSGTPNR